MARVLLAYSNFPRFVRIDRDLLAERHEVEEYGQPGVVTRPLEVVRKVRRADALVVWFASWHAFLPLLVARLLRTPSLLIVGGFDTAAMPEIGYGFQQGGIRRRLARACMRLATRLMTNSEYSRGELRRTAGFEAAVVHHGLPDPFGALPEGPRERIAITVSNVARIALERKGLRRFVEAGAHLPDVELLLVGAWTDDAADELRAVAPPNVRLTGRLSDGDLDDLLAARGGVRAGVAPRGLRHGRRRGDAGRVHPRRDRSGRAPGGRRRGRRRRRARTGSGGRRGVRHALELGPEARAAARERVVSRFPLQVRRDGLLGLVDELLA